MKTTILSLGLSLLIVGPVFTGCDDNNDSKITVTGTLTKVGSYNTSKEGGAEIVAFDKTSKNMYITNGEDKTLDIVSISDVTSPSLVSSIDITTYGTNLNSVAVADEKVAVAVEDGNDTVGKKQLKGNVVIFDTAGTHKRTVEVGYLPDMVTFNEDGTKIIVANEGEPSNDYTTDPVGSIGVINVSNYSYSDIGFSGVTLSAATDGTVVRLGDTPSNDQTKDLEPEYVTVLDNYAYVTLQENNALAKVDLSDNSISYVKSLGAKSYEADKSTIDIEENGEIEMKNFTGLFGLYQPDSIASYKVGNTGYLVTANEGDGREYIYESAATTETACDTDGGDWDATNSVCEVISHIDEKKISKLDLDSSIASEYANDNDLKVMTDLGKNSSDEYEKLYTYGARSFSIWDTNGDLVYDSGDEISKKVAQMQPTMFNQDEGEMDGRSGNKGAEPEALTIGTIGDTTLAFIGLERQNSIMVYDITNPQSPIFKQYINTESEGDTSPEGMKFIPSTESPNGKDLLLVSYEFSGSTVIYEVK